MKKYSFKYGTVFVLASGSQSLNLLIKESHGCIPSEIKFRLYITLSIFPVELAIVMEGWRMTFDSENCDRKNKCRTVY